MSGCLEGAGPGTEYDLCMVEVVLVLVSAGLGAGVVLAGVLFLRRKGADAPVKIHSETMVERVRSVGKLVGLEVHAKEIATSTKGWSWLPPILLSQAKIAMIFHFEKQYAVDLSRIRPSDVEELERGELGRSAKYRLRLPPIEGSLRLTDVTPYDVQAGRILGLLDVIQMNAQTQNQLIKAAQGQASELFQKNAGKYEREARQSIERRLAAFLRLFEADVEVVWAEGVPAGQRGDEAVSVSAELGRKLTSVG